MADESITRVYQFLNRNYSSAEEWMREADANEDNKIVKTEFRCFLLGQEDELRDYWNGEEKFDINDIVNKFWASIDTNVTGKVGKMSNKNVLDENEIGKIEQGMAAVEKIDNFVRSITAPDGVNSSRWKQSIKESLLNKALDFLKKNKDADIEQWDIQKAYEVSYRQTTADHVAAETIDSKLGKIDGYKTGEDKQLEKIIDSYVQSLSEDESTDINVIIANVKEIVSAYADTAETNSTASTELLAQYGYKTEGKLNDLQKAVLERDIANAIKEELTDKYSNIYTQENQAQFDSIISAYVKKYISGKDASDFTELKNFDVSDFIKTQEFTTLQTSLQKALDDLQKARTKLIEYLSDKYTNKYNDAIKEVFGENEKNKVEELIGGYNAETVAAKDTAIRAKIDEIDSRLDDDYWSGFPQAKTVALGSTATITLPNNYGKYNTGDLHFYSSNSSVLDFSADGGISGKGTIKGGTIEGKYSVTVTVKDGSGKVLGTRTIAITISNKNSDIVANAKFGENKCDDSRVFGMDDGHKQAYCYDFAALYNKGAIVVLTYNESERNCENAIKQLGYLGDMIVDALVNAGLDRTKLETAKTNVVEQYVKNGSNYGVQYTPDTDGYNYYHEVCGYVYEKMKDTKSADYKNYYGKHAIISHKDEQRCDEYTNMVNFRFLVDDILDEYKRL